MNTLYMNTKLDKAWHTQMDESDKLVESNEKIEKIDFATTTTNDFNTTEPASRFPKSILFIIGNEFCERYLTFNILFILSSAVLCCRFSFYGMKAILPLYLTVSLKFNQNRATTLIHFFNFSAYAFTLLGGIISDSFLGRYKTILTLSLVYCVGMAVLAGSALPWIAWNVSCFMVGLVLVAFGTGGIKPCVSAFGGDQFDPSQLTAITTYFSIFYFSINAGSVLSMFITPIIRQNVHWYTHICLLLLSYVHTVYIQCSFGRDECYPLAFGLPALLMLIATVVFVAGSRLYVKKPPSSDSSSLKVIKVISSASLNRLKAFIHPPANVPDSWLEYADISKYSIEFVHETRIVLKILLVFAPISLFWALYDQQGSRWTFQAIMMNGNIAGLFSIKPEQMGVFNAILILLLIPAFDRIIYPILSGMGISLQPLSKIFWGMTLAVSSFIIASGLQFIIESRGTFKSDVCVDGCVHVLWQLPQYLLLTCGEVMLSITGLEFAYSQAPESMKSVCSAAWLLTVAAGNLVVIFVNELDPVAWMTRTNQMAWNFLFWALILSVGTFCFALMASNYEYINGEDPQTVFLHRDEEHEKLIITE